MSVLFLKKQSRHYIETYTDPEGSFFVQCHRKDGKMTDEEIAVTIAEQKKEIGSLKHRVDELEENTDTIQKLTLSVQELAFNIQEMVKEQERYSKAQERAFERINALEEKPAKRWDSLTTVIITALASGIITYILSNIL